MPRLFSILLALSCLALVATMGCSSDAPDKPREASPPTGSRTLIFNGGPRGGTFNHFANKMAAVISEDVPSLDVRAKQSGGSLSNLLALCSGKADMAIVNAGDAFLGRTGKLHCSDKRYVQLRALAFLYGDPAQLVVRADSNIHTVLDLPGRTIAVGNPGSGAALSAERFFRHLKLWTKFKHQPVSYSQAAADFTEGKVDGLWTLAGYPTTSIIEAAASVPIRILNLHNAAAASGFYRLYPFYSQSTIPAGTYPGQTRPVDTFQDAALWCVRLTLDDRTVYDSLQAVFSAKRLAEMRRIHSAARHMGLKTGIDNLSVPMHPGAVRFWSEHGLNIPPILMP